MIGISREQARKMVGQGWSDLINIAYNALEHQDYERVHITDVKEKYGTLRIYIHGADTDLYQFISDIEEASSKICEECGQQGKLRTTLSWYKTLCDKHYKERSKNVRL